MSNESLYLILIRGISGSGKSTLSHKICVQYQALDCEADNWFRMKDPTQYIFEPTEISNAHLYCRVRTEESLRSGVNVVVSNTFTTIKELQPYADLAVKYNATVILMEPTTEWWVNRNVEELVKRNVNGVSREIIERQLARWIELPVGTYTPQDFKRLLNEANNKN